jgi:short chain dehydrogenase
MTQRPVVLITGGTRGIGRACADALAADHDLLIGGRDAEAVAAVCAELPAARPFVADLTDEAATVAAVEALGLERLDAVRSPGETGWSRSTRTLSPSPSSPGCCCPHCGARAAPSC